MSDDKQGMSMCQLKFLRLMFRGGLFVQVIGFGSNQVAKEVPVTLAKAKS
jgi:hypothetical protein